MQIVRRTRPWLCAWQPITLLLTLALSVELVLPMGSFAQQIQHPASTVGATVQNQELPPMQEVESIQERKPFYKKWWFWALVGVAVAGGVVGATAIGRGGSSPATGDVTVTGPAPQ